MSPGMVLNGPTFSPPEWTNDTIHPRDLLSSGVQIDASLFNAPDAVVLTVGAGGAAQNATSVPLASAIPAGHSVPSGTPLDFGGGKLAITNGVAAAGAMAVPVRALPTAVVSGDVATYRGAGVKYIPDGTAIGRTFTERDAGAKFGPLAVGDDEVFLTYTAILDASKNDSVTVVRGKNGVSVKETRLPGWATMASGVKALIRANFVTQSVAP